MKIGRIDLQKLQCLLGALTLVLVPSLVQAAVLTAVPMQGGMVMPMVSYHAGDGRLHVMMPTEIPQLTPLLISHPGDSFDPADPWFDTLDPSRQGASFSRRYGFVMDPMSDLLPPGTQMWIRKLSGPPELGFHRYSASAPKAFEPIFGTGGVTNALYWNGMMFHPVVAAPPGTNSYTAVFELYLLNTVSGAEIANSSSGPLGLEWTNVPDGRPALSLAPGIIVAWPASTPTNWVLESASAVNASQWTLVTNTPVILDGQPRVVLEPSGAARYLRMRYVP